MKKLLQRTMLLLCALIAGSSSVWAGDTWVKTAPTDLTSGDVVVLVDLTSGKAMTNNNGTSSAPSATAVTLNDGKTEITSAVADNLQWTVTATGTGDSRTYQLATGTDFLYVTATNNGVRVGSGERNTFKISTGGDNSGYYLNNTATEGSKEVTRYIGCYNSSDWRCYNSINSNIKGNNNAFFKKVSGSTPTCATPTFSPAAGAYISAQNVTITCATEGATIYYTTNGDEPTTGSSVYSSPIAVSANTTIKALAAKTSYNNSSIASAAYTFPTTTYNSIADLIAAAPTEPVILNLSNAQVLGVGAKDMYVKDASDALDFYQLGLTYTAGQMLNGKVVVTGYTLYNNYMPEITGIGENQIVATDGTLPTPTVLANGAAATLENYKWKFVTVTGTATDTREIDGLAIYTNLFSFENLIANVDNVTATGLIIPYKKNDAIISELLPTSLVYNITLSKDMVTYCSTNKLDFSGTGLKVYSAKVENGVAALTEIENAIVTKNKGIILTGTAGQTYNIPVTAADATGITTELVGVKAETAVAYSADSKYNYILQNGVFKKATGAKLKAGKAYLSTTYDVTAAGAPSLAIVIDGETTGIADVRSKMEDVRGDFFDLQGRKVAQPTKGLYIVNGKKVIVK